MTTVLLFIFVLAVLVFVHEFGHFSMAKLFGMRVDEFGLGFPPRAASFTPEDSETTYSLNWLPLGGFVSIFGENGEVVDEDGEAGAAAEGEDEADENRDGKKEHPDAGRSFNDKSTFAQVVVLAAGVIMNMILAFVLLAGSFMVGTLAAPDDAAGEVVDAGVIVTQTLPDSPAEAAGLAGGDKITAIRLATATSSSEEVTFDVVSSVVDSATNTPVVVSYERGEEMRTATITPAVLEDGDRQIGIAMAEAGTLKLEFFPALVRGAEATVDLTEQTVVGFWDLISGAVSGSGESLEQVAGPVGIADLVGNAADRGLSALLSFMALISINLAVLNLLPFPALDGGRIVFSIIEGISGRKIPAKVGLWVNGAGMAILLLFMVFVTYQDILRLL